MDLTKIILPDSIIVSGSVYKIHTGHPYWFRFSQLIQQKDMLLSGFDFIYINSKPEDRKTGFEKLLNFYYEKKELPRVDESQSCERILDYDIDSDLIYAAIMQCYHVDLYEKEMHWHKVRALINGLYGTKLNEIISYRICDPKKDKNLEKMKRLWKLPEIQNEDDKEALDNFNKIFYK